MDKAYKEACKNGTTKSFRAKLDIIGHTDVGKTSLTCRLLGQPFSENKESTEGIATHHIKSQFSPSEMKTGVWKEMANDSEEIVAKFNSEILKKYQQLSTRPANLEELKVENMDRTELNKMEPYKEKEDKEDKSLLASEKQVEIEPGEDNSIPGIPEAMPVVQEPSATQALSYENSFKTKDPGIAEMSSRTREELLDKYQSRPESSSTSDVDYSIRLWDFGGHTEFLATHHLFLNSECPTLVLLDISKSLTEPISSRGIDIPNSPEKFLHYWLNAVHTKAIDNGQEPNIALVLTHKDMIKAPDTEQYIEEFISEVMTSLKGKSYSKYITNENIFVISNKTDDEKDFQNLRSKVFSMITKLRSWNIERPTRWLKLEADILEKSSESRNYLEFPEVQQLANAYAINEEELKSFLNFHHVLGDFLYFQEPDLEDIVIPDPQWLADIFKTLITPEEFIKQRKLDPKTGKQVSQGLVTFNTLKILWEESQVPFLVTLFQNFNLLVPIGSPIEGERKDFIVPCMLPPKPSDMYEQEPFKSMVLTYNSEHATKATEPFQIGTFHKLLSQCSKIWKICADDHLLYTDASFHIKENVRLAITSIKREKIRVSVWCTKDAIEPFTAHLIQTIRRCLENMFTKLGLASSTNYLLQCPHWSIEDSEACLVRVTDVTKSYTIQPVNKVCPRHKKDVLESHFPGISTGE